MHRGRAWDAVATVEASHPGDSLVAVVLDDGRVLIESGETSAEVGVLVRAVRSSLRAPFRLEAVRRGPALWAVGGRSIETVELAPELVGDEIEVAFDGRERTVVVDGSPTLAGVAALEAIGARVGHAYVVTATRIVGATWEVTALPL
jgi:anti-sigma factor ChrR (cupin superfamily)